MAMAVIIMLMTTTRAYAQDDDVVNGLARVLVYTMAGAWVGSTLGEVGKGAAIGAAAGVVLPGLTGGRQEVRETVYYTPPAPPQYYQPQVVYVAPAPPVYSNSNEVYWREYNTKMRQFQYEREQSAQESARRRADLDAFNDDARHVRRWSNGQSVAGGTVYCQDAELGVVYTMSYWQQYDTRMSQFQSEREQRARERVARQGRLNAFYDDWNQRHRR